MSLVPSTLVLFDIDGTLMRSQGVGVSSMQATFDELYPNQGLAMDGVSVAGRLDTLIWGDVLTKHGVARTPDAENRFRARYREILGERLHAATVRRMPGVLELVARLSTVDAAVVGLLTGNWPDTAQMKLQTAGFDTSLFRLGAFAGDGADRRSLPPVAMQRFHDLTGLPPRPDRTVIIGDTPLDVDCAHYNGCRAIAVATGDFTVEELRATGADLVVGTLEDVDALEHWIIS